VEVLKEIEKDYVAVWKGKYADEMFRDLASLMKKADATVADKIYAAIAGKVGEAFVVYLKHPTDGSLNLFIISPEPLEIHRRLGIK